MNLLPKNIPFGGSYRGVKENLDYFVLMMECIRIKDFRVDRILVEGDSAVIFGFEKSEVLENGREYQMDWVHIIQFKDGKVIYGREYNDTAAMTPAFPKLALVTGVTDEMSCR